MKNYSQKYLKKAQEYENIRDKISSIEEMIGLTVNEDEKDNLDVRLDELDINIMQLKNIFRQYSKW